MPKAILKFEAAVIKEYPILSSILTVGREADNDIVIDHPAVSKHHCRIIFQGNVYFAEDLNSTNGTLLNGKKIIKAGLHTQDELTIAKHTLVFIDDRPAAGQAEPAVSAEAPPAAIPAGESAAKFEKGGRYLGPLGGVRVTEGIVDQIEFILSETSTYIGKSERAAIKIKAGMFAPEVAAMINRRTNGYFLVAIKEGYPKINGMPVQTERGLNEGDMIEVGSTIMQFYLKSS